MHVFVLDKDKNPLAPCHPAKARRLLKSGRASVFRRYPFTLILHEIEAKDCVVPETQLKIDPGSQTTGLAILSENRVIWASELSHRGQQIKNDLEKRRALRRSRRHRKTRYRKPRCLNRTRPKGWLLPSLNASAPLSVESERSRGLNHRVETTMTWVNRLRKLCPIVSIAQELVRFDTQKLQNPEVSGIEYQQGELLGYEIREFLLEKWGRKCASLGARSLAPCDGAGSHRYCGAENLPLEVEHIHPKSQGGSDRVSNLTLACHTCNQAKGNRDIREFLSGKPTVLNRILKQAKAPLKDAAAVNATRWKLYQQLKETGLPVEVGTGGQTKFNRTRLGLPKTHWFDAACVGKSTPDRLDVAVEKPLLVAAKGHGVRQRCRSDRYGFPRTHAPKAKSFQGFQTGDIVKATIPQGKFAGNYTGRIAIRFRPSFRLNAGVKPFDVHPKYLTTVQKSDGYEYRFSK
ncbi:RNA-guided endonuclease IscB [Baaleninema simplex]|uniref:RNA-guided endonuclease IscB n=1 Tax=Baaleninema simplex TaxID=2862350 RepID=UPI000347E635|nr:RNA-guided endonuclease IscB [Baaleninema simplex]